MDSLLQATAGKLGGGAEGEEEQVDPALAQARDFLDNGDFDGALAAYQAILEADPAHVEAKGAVQQIAFLQRASAQRPEAVRLADASPDDIDLAFAAADVQLFQRDVHGAFNRLIALVKKTSGDDRTRVRTRLIELFDCSTRPTPRSSRAGATSPTPCTRGVSSRAPLRAPRPRSP